MQYTDFKEFNKQSGIYCIINTVNNKRYIGSAINLYERIRQHQHELSNNVHFNTHLQQSFIKYGIDCFKVEILETCVCSYDELLKIEDKYILEYNCLDANCGYNKRLSNVFPTLTQKSIDVRNKKRELRKIKVKLFYADNGEFYADFDSVTDVAIFLNDQTTNISKIRDNLTMSCKGFTIISYDKYDPNKNYKKIPYKRSLENIKNSQLSSPSNKKVYEYDKNGTLINIYFSCSEATRKLNLKRDALSHMLKRHNTIIYNKFLYSYSEVNNNFTEIYNTS